MGHNMEKTITWKPHTSYLYINIHYTKDCIINHKDRRKLNKMCYLWFTSYRYHLNPIYGSTSFQNFKKFQLQYPIEMLNAFLDHNKVNLHLSLSPPCGCLLDELDSWIFNGHLRLSGLLLKTNKNCGWKTFDKDSMMAWNVAWNIRNWFAL